mgnify:FL=1
MEYKVKDLGSYKLHLIKNDKFKTIRTKVFFNAPVKRKEITIRNFLAAMLMATNEKYKTRRDIALKCQDLYSCNIGYNISRFGNYSNLCFSLNVLEDKYSEDGNLEEALRFFSDIIYKPNVSSNMFDEKVFQIVKSDALISLSSLKENGDNYSLIRMLEEMDSSSPLSYRAAGYLEDLEQITPTILYDYYKNMIDRDIMDIFVIGNIDFKEIEDIIRANFPTKIFKKITIPCRLEEKNSRSKKLIKLEENDSNQSKLAVGCRLVGLTDYERNYALTIYNIILGGGTDSKLFKEVREAHSMAYYISSVVNKLDNIMLIRAGITRDNFDSVVKLIGQEMNQMKKGKFLDDDIAKAKQIYLSAIDEIEESQSDIIDSYYMMDLLGVDDIKTKKKKMMLVSRDDIIKVSKKVFIDTIYMLEGVKE